MKAVTELDGYAMNQFVPDWKMEGGSRSPCNLLPAANQKEPTGRENELMELLWRDGHVVMHSQNHRKPAEFKQVQRSEQLHRLGEWTGNASNSSQEDETASWLQYPVYDSFEKEFCSDFLYEMPIASATEATKINQEIMAGERGVKFASVGLENILLPPKPVEESISRLSSLSFQQMPAPKSNVAGPTTQVLPTSGSRGVLNFSHFSKSIKPDSEFGKQGSGKGVQVEAGESSSMMTVGSSVCGSNQVRNAVDLSCTASNDATSILPRCLKDDVQMILPFEKMQVETHDATVASSSGGSASTFERAGQPSASNQCHKRKGVDAEDSECHSEDTEYESQEPKKSAQRSASVRRSRAAEVHNLSERRRRDRINEKMKALQELIPHCNKADKASMLDEAIEYLKSLQLQVQMMWMGGNMAPMMFPGVQQYMPGMNVGMGHTPLHTLHSPVQLQEVPLINQPMPSVLATNQTPIRRYPALNPVDFPTQMQNFHFSESYARYIGMHHMQPSHQAMNIYAYGSQAVKQDKAAASITSSRLPAAGVPSQNVQDGQSG